MGSKLPEHCANHLAALQEDAKLFKRIIVQGTPDPDCRTGVLSALLPEGGQVCVPSFCAEATDNEGCKSMHGVDSEEQCCISRVAEQSCDRQTAPCVKTCIESVPPCTVPKGHEFKKPLIGAAEDCTQLPEWDQMVKVATSDDQKDDQLAGLTEWQGSEDHRQVNLAESSLEHVLSLPVWNLANVTFAVDQATSIGVHGRLLGAAYGLQSTLNSIKESIRASVASGNPREISAAVVAGKLARLDESEGIEDGLALVEKLKAPHAQLKAVLGQLEPKVQDVQAALLEARKAGLEEPQVGQAMDLLKLLELNSHKVSVLVSSTRTAQEAVKASAVAEADALAKKQAETKVNLKVARLEKDLAIAKAVLKEAEAGNLTVVEEGKVNAASAVLFIQVARNYSEKEQTKWNAHQKVSEKTAHEVQAAQEKAKKRRAESVARAVAAARERGRAKAERAAAVRPVAHVSGEDAKDFNETSGKIDLKESQTGHQVKTKPLTANGTQQAASSSRAAEEMQALQNKISAFDHVVEKHDTNMTLPDSIEPIIDTATEILTKSSPGTAGSKSAFDLKWGRMEDTVTTGKQDRLEEKLDNFDQYLHTVSIKQTNTTLLNRVLDTLTRMVSSSEHTPVTLKGHKKEKTIYNKRNQTAPTTVVYNSTKAVPASNVSQMLGHRKIKDQGRSKAKKKLRSKAEDFDAKWAEMEEGLEPVSSRNTIGDVVKIGPSSGGKFQNYSSNVSPNASSVPSSEGMFQNHTSKVSANVSSLPPSGEMSQNYDSEVEFFFGRHVSSALTTSPTAIAHTTTTTTAMVMTTSITHNISVHAIQEAGAKAIHVLKDATESTTKSMTPMAAAQPAASNPYDISVRRTKSAGDKALDAAKDEQTTTTSTLTTTAVRTSTTHDVSVPAIKEAGAKAVDILKNAAQAMHDEQRNSTTDVAKKSTPVAVTTPPPPTGSGKFDMLRVSPTFIRNLRFPHVKDLKETRMVQNISKNIEQALVLAQQERDAQAKEVQRAQSQADQAKVDAEKAEKDLQNAQSDLIEQQVSSFDVRLSAQLGHFQELAIESEHMSVELTSLAQEHKTHSEDLKRVQKEMFAARRQLAVASGKVQAITHLSDYLASINGLSETGIKQAIASSDQQLDQQVKLLVHGQQDLELQERELETVYEKLDEEIKTHASGLEEIQSLSKELSSAHVSYVSLLKDYEKDDASCEQLKVKQIENEHNLKTMLAAESDLMTFKSGAEEDQEKKPLLDVLESEALEVEADCMDLDRRCSEKDATSCKLLKVKETELELRLVAVQEKMTKLSDLEDDLSVTAAELSTLQPRIEAEQKDKEDLKKGIAEVCTSSTKQDLDAGKQKIAEFEQQISVKLKEMEKADRHLRGHGEQVSQVDHKIELLVAGALSPAEQNIISIEEELAYLKINEAVITKTKDQAKLMLASEQSNAQSNIQLQERAVDECQKQIQTKIDLLSSAEANIDMLVGKLDSTTQAMVDVQETMKKLHMSINPLEDRIANLAEPAAISQEESIAA